MGRRTEGLIPRSVCEGKVCNSARYPAFYVECRGCPAAGPDRFLTQPQ